ncbi:MAG: hypothetical protein LBF86_02335, partial [Helicobacteraceae bacterium]|nr:hypothetical protein [Helicobacteraceae bacterium]
VIKPLDSLLSCQGTAKIKERKTPSELVGRNYSKSSLKSQKESVAKLAQATIKTLFFGILGARRFLSVCFNAAGKNNLAVRAPPIKTNAVDRALA